MAQAQGVASSLRGITDVRNPPPDEALAGLVDRGSGAALVAEALSAKTAIGAFREYVRLFENGFGTSNRSKLIKPQRPF